VRDKPNYRAHSPGNAMHQYELAVGDLLPAAILRGVSTTGARQTPINRAGKVRLGLGMMLAYGASVKALQNALGHASATMTLNVYSHLIASDLDDAVLARANQVLTGAEGKLVQFPRRGDKA